VFGVLLIRDAVDLVEVNLRHHLALGLERIEVVDNGSTDGTWELVGRLARRLPVDRTRDEGPYLQEQLVNAAVQRAGAAGADWVLPMDADEFFVCERGLHEVLAEQTGAGVVQFACVNFIQRREQLTCEPAGLLTMDTRVRRPISWHYAAEHIRAGRLGMVEAEWNPNVIVRPTPELWVEIGNHSARDACMPSAWTEDITCLHAPVRAREALIRRAEHGRRVEEADLPADTNIQLRGLPADPQGVDRLWRANSSRDGHLDTDDGRRPVELDTRLRDAVEPHLRRPAARALAGLSGRLRRSGRGPSEELAAMRRSLAAHADEVDALRRQLEGTWELADLHGRVQATAEWIRLAEVPEDLLISVITPTRNRAQRLGRALSSLFAQSYTNWELMIVDDGSTDATAEVIDSLSDPRVRGQHTEGVGASAARNLGMAEARGDFVVYLDDDNAFHPDWLRSVAWAVDVYGADVLYGAILGQHAGTHASPEIQARGPVLSLARFDREELLQRNLVDGGQLAHRRDLAESHWDRQLDGCADWDLLLRLSRSNEVLALPAIAIAYTWDGEDRISNDPRKPEYERAVLARHAGGGGG
jgi:glycosyltransferase involved in cell wall biosynthesis